MGMYIQRLPDPIETFVMGFWDTDAREQVPSATALNYMRQGGIESDVRAFLLDVIQHDAVSPEEWQKLVNAQTWTPSAVREDATRFWEWLFDEAPLAGDGSPLGEVQPPQV